MPDPGISRLPDWLSLRSRTHADKLAIRDKDESITYSELNHRVQFAESQLAELGFAEGQILCVLAENSVEFAVLFHTACLLYTSPSPRDRTRSRMPSSA